MYEHSVHILLILNLRFSIQVNRLEITNEYIGYPTTI